MKKILFMSHYFTAGGIDGANNILLRIVSALPREKYDPIVIVPDYGMLYYELIKREINTMVFNYNCADFDGFVYRDQDKSSIDPICSNMENYLRETDIYQFLCEWKPDIVYANSTMGIITAVLGKMVGAKVIWHVHDISQSFLGEQDCINTHKIIDRYADKIVVVGKKVREQLGFLANSPKCELVYIGVKEPGLSRYETALKGKTIRAKLGFAQDIPIFAFLGRISWEKGIDHFIYAADLVLKKHSSCKFIIIGSNKYGEEYYEKLNKLIQDISREDAISFIGYYSDIGDILPAIDCLVVPSVYEEPMAAVSVEANLYFKPVVAYDRGGIGEAVLHNKNGYMVEANNIGSMADFICEIITNKEQTKRMGIFGHQRALYKFGYERFIKTSIDIINEAAEGQYVAKAYRDGDIVGLNKKACYLIENGYKRAIRRLSVLKYMGLSEEDIILLDEHTLSQIPSGKRVSAIEVIL